MDTVEALVWTAPLVLGLVAWQAFSFPLGMLAMFIASALVWYVFEYEP